MRDVSNEMREFLADLQVFANGWVKEVQQVIVDHIDELYKDEAIRYMAKKYREEVESVRRFNQNTLLDAIRFERPVMKHEVSCMYDFSSALYELCYRRFKQEEEKKENA